MGLRKKPNSSRQKTKLSWGVEVLKRKQNLSKQKTEGCGYNDSEANYSRFNSVGAGRVGPCLILE